MICVSEFWQKHILSLYLKEKKMTVAEKVMLTFTEEDWQKIKDSLIEDLQDNLQDCLKEYYVLADDDGLMDLISETIEDEVKATVRSMVRKAIAANQDLLSEVVAGRVREELEKNVRGV